MAITISQIMHTLVGPRDSAVLAIGIYQITAWNPYESEGAGDPDTFDFSAAAAGSDPSLRFRIVYDVTPMVLTRAAGGDGSGIVVQLRRRSATVYGIIAERTGIATPSDLAEVPDGTNLSGYVSADPSPARFWVIGQPASDPVTTPIRSW